MSGHTKLTTYKHVVHAAIRAGLSEKQIILLINQFASEHHPISNEFGEYPRNVKVQADGIKHMLRILENQTIKIL